MDQKRSVRAAESPQSAALSDNPRVTAPVNFSALMSRYSAPTRSSSGSACPGEIAVEPSRNANNDKLGNNVYAAPTLHPNELWKSAPGGDPTNVYATVTYPYRGPT